MEEWHYRIVDLVPLWKLDGVLTIPRIRRLQACLAHVLSTIQAALQAAAVELATTPATERLGRRPVEAEEARVARGGKPPPSPLISLIAAAIDSNMGAGMPPAADDGR
jgi:hypothetical protein